MLNVDALPMTPSMQDSAAGGPPCAMGLYCVAVHSTAGSKTPGEPSLEPGTQTNANSTLEQYR
jgi:hypothetical protein